MNYILFDDSKGEHLLPLTYTRPIAEIRIGILTFRERWEVLLHSPCSYLTQTYLQKKFPLNLEDDNLLINGGVYPDNELLSAIQQLQSNESLCSGDVVLAARVSGDHVRRYSGINVDKLKNKLIDCNILYVNSLWSIFQLNVDAIERDFQLLADSGNLSKSICERNTIYGTSLFIEEGAKVRGAIINSEKGAVYIGKEAEIMEGTLIQGPVAICGGATVKMGTKIYGGTTIGPYSKVGGEISNSVITGFSNKGHDGYLGNSILGEWCNIGADSNSSNLRNDYSNVKVWDYPAGKFINTGTQFCGLIMADHSKCGINTMFNTGTVAGVNSNIYGAGFSRTFIPSFSWGGANGFKTYNLDKALEVAEVVMKRRNITMTDDDRNILTEVFKQSAKFRS